MKLELLFAYFSSLSALLPLGIGLFHFKRISFRLKSIVWLAIASIVADALSLLLLSNGKGTWFIVNLFFIAQFTLLYACFRRSLSNRYLDGVFWLFIAFAILNYAFWEQPNTFNTSTAYVGGIFLILIALLYLQKLLKKNVTESVMNLPLLWISYGILTYYAGTLFLFLFNNYLVKHSPENHYYIWMLHNLLNITKNVFFSVALWKSYKAKM